MNKLYIPHKLRSFLLIAFFAISSASATVITITVGPSGNNTFSPANVSAVSGDTIKWIWGSGTHTTTSTTIPAGASAWNQNITMNQQTYSMVVSTPGTYNYKCSIHSMMTGTITVTGTSGITQNLKPNLVSIFPNPFNKSLVIDFKNYDFSSKPTIELYDIVGKQYLHTKYFDNEKNSKMTLDLDFLDPGVYFIYIINYGKKEIYKVIKSNDGMNGSSSLFNSRETPDSNS